MGILVNQNTDLIPILIMFIEKKNKHGNYSFHFINSKEDLESWKSQGYIMQDEYERLKNEPVKHEPGMPVKSPLDPNMVIQTLKTWWSKSDWRNTNRINSKCVRQTTNADGTKSAELDAIMYRDLRIKSALKSWDLKDESGKVIPVTENVIDSLVPEVAYELLNNYDKVTASEFKEDENDDS